MFNPLSFVSGLGFRTYLIGGLSIVLAIAVYIGYNYVTGLQKKVIEQAASLAVIEMALDETNKTITRLERDRVESARRIRELDIKMNDAERVVEDLRDLLSKHDLTRLSRSKPELIERRINEATDKVFRDIEQLTTP